MHGPGERISPLRAQHRHPRSVPGGASAGTRALRRRRRKTLPSPKALSETCLRLKVSSRPLALPRGPLAWSGGVSLPHYSEARVAPRCLPGFAVRPGDGGGREIPEPSGRAGSLAGPINSFAREDLQGRPSMKQFANNRIFLPPP